MEYSQGSESKGRRGVRRDRSEKKHPNSDKLCPLLVEYCKGPKCMFYQNDLDVCTIPLGLEAWWMMSKKSGTGEAAQEVIGEVARKFSDF